MAAAPRPAGSSWVGTASGGEPRVPGLPRVPREAGLPGGHSCPEQRAALPVPATEQRTPAAGVSLSP